MIEALANLRRTLHQYPELSNCESETAMRIAKFVKDRNPTTILTELGGHGVAVCYEFAERGPTIAIRCELDALPIQEDLSLTYRSKHQGVSHKCGHDGHMTIVAGLSVWLQEQKFERGKVVLLFQPAEETGKGAEQMMNDLAFRELQIDYLFALHNIPGEKMHQIITMDAGFSAEVISFAISITGVESHAAEPEKGINPSSTISKIIEELDKLNQVDPNKSDFAVLTPVHIRMGEKAYGISPANAELHYTIRTWYSSKMNSLQKKIVAAIEKICKENSIQHNIDWFEYFPAADNYPECNIVIKEAAKSIRASQKDRPFPFKFGEDFGWFSKEYKTGMFGLGAGIETPSLHNKDYDFPDELIPTGMKMFKAIISRVLDV